MRYRCSQFYMAHAFPTHFGPGNLYAATITYNPFVANALVLAAMTLPVLLRTKDLFAKQTFFFWFKGSVIDGFGLFHFASGPSPNLLWRGQTNAQGIKIIDIQQNSSPFTNGRLSVYII